MIRYLSIVGFLFLEIIVFALPATHAYLSVPDLKKLAYASWDSELCYNRNAACIVYADRFGSKRGRCRGGLGTPGWRFRRVAQGECLHAGRGIG